MAKSVTWREQIDPWGASFWFGTTDNYATTYRVGRDSTRKFGWFVVSLGTRDRWGPFDFAEEAKKFVETWVTLNV